MLAVLAAEPGCDQGDRELEAGHGPALHLSASYPADGQGTNAALDANVDCGEPTPDCPVPTDVAIELRFDRFLLPAGGLAAGLTLYSGDPGNAVALRADYDLLERVVVARPTRRLQPHALYTAELRIGSNPNQGFWAFDRAPLEPGEIPLRFSFTTGSGPSAEAALAPAPSETCETQLLGALSSCASCHAPSDATGNAQFPPMGLDLSSARGLRDTAIAKAAHQTETANSLASTGVQAPVRFGVQMNVVDPGNPATSYLMYKLLQKPENFRLLGSDGACPTRYHSPVSALGCTPPDAAEVTRLREWFVHGDPMPEDGHAADGTRTPTATDYASIRRLTVWIAAGASCPDPR